MHGGKPRRKRGNNSQRLAQGSMQEDGVKILFRGRFVWMLSWLVARLDLSGKLSIILISFEQGERLAAYALLSSRSLASSSSSRYQETMMMRMRSPREWGSKRSREIFLHSHPASRKKEREKKSNAFMLFPVGWVHARDSRDARNKSFTLALSCRPSLDHWP